MGVKLPVTRFVSRTLIHQIVSVSGRHRTDYPEGVRQSSADRQTESRGPESLHSPPNLHEKTQWLTFKPERHLQAFSATQTVRARYCQLVRYNLNNSICPGADEASGTLEPKNHKKIWVYQPYIYLIQPDLMMEVGYDGPNQFKHLKLIDVN